MGVEIAFIFTLWRAASWIQADCQICHIGHETWTLAIVPEVAHVNVIIGKTNFRSCIIISFYLNGVEVMSLCGQGQGSGFGVGRFPNWHIWQWNMSTGESCRCCTNTLFLSWREGVEIELIFSLWAVVKTAILTLTSLNSLVNNIFPNLIGSSTHCPLVSCKVWKCYSQPVLRHRVYRPGYGKRKTI